MAESGNLAAEQTTTGRPIEADYLIIGGLRRQTGDTAVILHRGRTRPVRRFIPGIDLYQLAGAACSDFRGSVIVPRVGHWVQQEAPDATDLALEGFLAQV